MSIIEKNDDTKLIFSVRNFFISNLVLLISLIVDDNHVHSKKRFIAVHIKTTQWFHNNLISQQIHSDILINKILYIIKDNKIIKSPKKIE